MSRAAQGKTGGESSSSASDQSLPSVANREEYFSEAILIYAVCFAIFCIPFFVACPILTE
jgi:hypothetical protein